MMEFNQKKLPQVAATKLRSCRIQSVQPYAPMLAPVYVYMKRNEKFVSVKSPLDFFLPEELNRFSPFESFFFPEFVDSLAPFQKAGRLARALLTRSSENGEILPPAPFEISDSLLRLVGPLWSVNSGQDLIIEPFFVIAFANEICDPIPQYLLLRGREQSVESYERALICSSLCIFLAAHLGYCHFEILNELRINTFENVITGTVPLAALPGAGELQELEFVTCSCFKNFEPIRAVAFETRSETVAKKLSSRIRRITVEFVVPGKPVPTIFGERGFASV